MKDGHSHFGIFHPEFLKEFDMLCRHSVKIEGRVISLGCFYFYFCSVPLLFPIVREMLIIFLLGPKAPSLKLQTVCF